MVQGWSEAGDRPEWSARRAAASISPAVRGVGGWISFYAAMRAPSLSPEVLAALAQRFRIVRELARGGMGTVLLAQDTSLDREVALKILTPERSQFLGDDRFSREIRLTARLVHPNIVPLYDSGSAAGSLYYVMPYIDGPTLRERLDREGPRPVAEVVRIIADLSEALAYAHSNGTVHRDLKPENVFWYRDRALLADFGIAVSVTEQHAAERVSGTGTVIGTLPYVSPEQASGEREVDGRSDLYGLGCVAFELLTGHPPYPTWNPVALLAAHLSAPIPSAAALRPDIPDALEALLTRLLAKAPEDRPATAAALLRELRSATDGPAASGGAPTAASRLGGLPREALEPIEQGVALYTTAMHGGTGAERKLETARIYFEKALARLPGNPHALAVLGDVVFVTGIRGFADFDAAAHRARELRYQALAANEDAGEVHTSLGATYLYWEDEFELAGEELRRGVELSPWYPPGRRLYGAWLKIAGRVREALAEMQAAVALAPDAPFLQVGLADVLMALGRYDEAIDPLRRALRFDARYEAALERLEMSCHRAGRQEEALDARRALLGLRGATERMRRLTERAAAEGWPTAREADLRDEAADLLARAGREDPFQDLRGSRQLCDRLLIVLAELGEWSQAMDWVERAYHRRPGRLRRMLTDLPYDYHGLATDSRYARLLRTAGLEDLLAP